MHCRATLSSAFLVEYKKKTAFLRIFPPDLSANNYYFFHIKHLLILFNQSITPLFF